MSEKSYADQERDEYFGEGQKPVLETGELTEDQLENAIGGDRYARLISQLTEEQAKSVLESKLLLEDPSIVVATLQQMIDDNKRGLNM